MEVMPENIPTVNQFNLEEVKDVVKALSLNSVTMGDYEVIMNSVEDITILGEPYLALQLWLNMRSGKFMGRVWSQTISNGKVETIAQFTEACISLFESRPCLGYPLCVEQATFKGEFVISQTPLPRMMSTECLKVLDKETNANITSCAECLKLRVEKEPKEDILIDHVKEEDNATEFEGFQDEHSTLTLKQDMYMRVVEDMYVYKDRFHKKTPAEIQIQEKVEDEKKQEIYSIPQKLNDLRQCYDKKREEILSLSRKLRFNCHTSFNQIYFIETFLNVH